MVSKGARVSRKECLQLSARLCRHEVAADGAQQRPHGARRLHVTAELREDGVVPPVDTTDTGVLDGLDGDDCPGANLEDNRLPARTMAGEPA